MMAEFTMPSLGADMASGTLVEWNVEPGDTVEKGDIVAVVETDKGAIDVEIFLEGVVEELLVQPQTTVPVGAALARIRVEGEQPKASVGAPATPTDEAEPLPAAGMSPSVEHVAPTRGRARVSPHARKVARELGIDPDNVEGTGPHGTVTAQDVQRAAATAPAAPTAAERMRAAIAAAMARSKREIPHYYLAHTIDLETALSWLERTNASRPIAERLLPIAVLVRAVAMGLRAYPQLCGWWRDGRFVPSENVHVGVAVALRGDAGLVNPAVHDADAGDLGALMAKIRDVTQRARAGQLRSSELSDAAITVTNMGDQGVSTVFGVIHPPQVAIVGFGTIARRPWVVGRDIEPRRAVDVSLAADHRASDGHLGGRFLRHIDRVLREPESL